MGWLSCRHLGAAQGMQGVGVFGGCSAIDYPAWAPQVMSICPREVWPSQYPLSSLPAL